LGYQMEQGKNKKYTLALDGKKLSTAAHTTTNNQSTTGGHNKGEDKERMAANGRHNNPYKMSRCGGEEDGEEGRNGAGAGCQCAMSASKEGERWQCSPSLMIAHCWLMTLSTMTPIRQQRPQK
jgi:hypothetical protein